MMQKDYHEELSSILRALQNQSHLVANCGEMGLTSRERRILYALVMKEIDSLHVNDNPVIVPFRQKGHVSSYSLNRENGKWEIFP